MTKQVDIEKTARDATKAALAVIDEALSNTSNQSTGPCGDDLAGILEKTILAALEDHMKSDLAPMF